ncbi:MAG: hypothetical protein ACLUG9_04785 [Paraclostridium sordellii]
MLDNFTNIDDESLCFRSLDNLKSEKNRTLNFQDIDIKDRNIIDVMKKYVSYIRATLNNRKEEKLYSYSKCICIPLFKYSKNKEFPIIAIMNGKLNSVDISFSCNYYQWIKGYYTKDDDRNYITENYLCSQKFYDLTKLLNNIPNIDRNQANIDLINKLECQIKNSGEFDIEMCDLDSVEDIKVIDFLIDLSNIDRCNLNKFIKKFLVDKAQIKRLAGFNKDFEIISSYRSNKFNSVFIKGNKLINIAKYICICIIFTEENKDKLNADNYKIIYRFLDEYLKSISEYSQEDIVILLKKIMNDKGSNLNNWNSEKIYEFISTIERSNYTGQLDYELYIEISKIQQIIDNIIESSITEKLEEFKDKLVLKIIIEHMKSNYKQEFIAIWNAWESLKIHSLYKYDDLGFNSVMEYLESYKINFDKNSESEIIYDDFRNKLIKYVEKHGLISRIDINN